MASIKPLTLQVIIIISHYLYNGQTLELEYTIGALLSNETMIEEFKDAVRQENENYKMQNITVSPKGEIMALRALKAAEQVCDLIKVTNQKMFALIVSHPPNSLDTPPLSASFTCAFYSIPVLGISARQSAFSDKYSHSSFLRTVPPYSEEARVWTDLIREFKWREISLIHSDDQEGKTLLSRLERASDDSKQFRITRSAPFPADEDLELPTNFTQLLRPIKQDQTRAIVLYARPEFAKRIFDAATQLKMITKDWAWIVTEQVLTMDNLPQGLIGLKLSRSSERDHIRDAVAVVTKGLASLKINEELNKQNIISVIKAPRHCSQNPFKIETRINRVEHKWSDSGQKIYQYLKQVTLDEGKTGFVKFDDKGDRVLPVYDIVNIQQDPNDPRKTLLKEVGTYGIKRQRPPNWDPKEPFLELLSLSMEKIMWPGNDRITLKKEICIPLNNGLNNLDATRLAKQDSSIFLDQKWNNQRILSVTIGDKSLINAKQMAKSNKISIENSIKSSINGNANNNNNNNLNSNSNNGECKKVTIEVAAAPKSFMKKTNLKVVTKRSIPFVETRLIDPLKEKCDTSNIPTILKKEVPCTHKDPITKKIIYYCCKGYCIDLLRRLANRTGIEDNHTPFDYELHLVGDGEVGQEKLENDTKRWTGMVGELLSGEADLAVAPMTITPDRAARVEFTKPFKYLGLTILVKREESRSNLGSFLQPFENTLWVLVALSVHVVALVLYLLDRFSPFGRFKLAKSSSTEEDALNLSSAMWFAWGVLLNSGIGEGTPRSFSARVLGMVWAGFAMIIVASYTANLAAFLVLDRPEASISGIDDARLRNPQKEFRFATVRGSPVEQYFKRQVEYATMYRMMEQHNTENADKAIEMVKTGELKAFIWDSARISYEASRNCKLITAGEVFGRNGYGLAMKKDNPWLYEMSQAVLNFHERGFMENLDTNWILVKAEGCDRAESSPATLGLTNMAGVFIMVAAGIVAGVFLIFIEIAYKKRRGLKEKELELAKNAVDRWRGNIEKRKILRKTLSTESDFHRYFNNNSSVAVGGNKTIIGDSSNSGPMTMMMSHRNTSSDIPGNSSSVTGPLLLSSNTIGPGSGGSHGNNNIVKDTRIFFDNEIQV